MTPAGCRRMTGGMRYAQRGGYTPAEQQRRERLRLEAAGRFARGDGIGAVATGVFRGRRGCAGRMMDGSAWLVA